MIVTKTPLRCSFFGGGSDIPEFYNRSPGMVISTAIDKHINIALNNCRTNHVRVVYSQMEVVDNIDQLQHDRVREALKHFKIFNNIELCSFSDVPTKGTGLGSSSTFTVGVLNAIYNYLRLPYNKCDLAELACDIEINKCNQPIGKQDQYAAAYGGFNVFRFDSSGVEVTPINIRWDSLQDLNENLMCYSTGIERQTSDILSDQVDNLKNNISTFDQTKMMVDIAEYALKCLHKGNINMFGMLLHDTWQLKKKLAPNITNPHIDEMYETGISSGALGGKLLGAGGGGYMLFYVPKEARSRFSFAMKYYRAFHFSFCDQGSSWVRV